MATEGVGFTVMESLSATVPAIGRSNPFFIFIPILLVLCDMRFWGYTEVLLRVWRMGGRAVLHPCASKVGNEPCAACARPHGNGYYGKFSAIPFSGGKVSYNFCHFLLKCAKF